MTDNETLAKWIEDGLNLPEVKEEKYDSNQISRWASPYRGMTCDIYMLALIGKQGSFDAAKNVYETTKKQLIPVQVKTIGEHFNTTTHLWAYLLNIPYDTARRLSVWHTDCPNAKGLINALRSGKF
jgi:hypothetical protein